MASPLSSSSLDYLHNAVSPSRICGPRPSCSVILGSFKSSLMQSPKSCALPFSLSLCASHEPGHCSSAPLHMKDRNRPTATLVTLSKPQLDPGREKRNWDQYRLRKVTSSVPEPHLVLLKIWANYPYFSKTPSSVLVGGHMLLSGLQVCTYSITTRSLVQSPL